MMTKKDFELIAEAINRSYRANADIVNCVNFLQDSVIPEFIILLAGSNPRFDTEKFKKACFKTTASTQF